MTNYRARIILIFIKYNSITKSFYNKIGRVDQ